MMACCRMHNGGIGDKTHYCFDAATGEPCCEDSEDFQDKYCRHTVNALFGRLNHFSAESRWTDTVPSFVLTLLRRITGEGIGTGAFPRGYGGDGGEGGAAEGEPQTSLDGEAADGYFQMVNNIRAKTNYEYLNRQETFNELGGAGCTHNSLPGLG